MSLFDAGTEASINARPLSVLPLIDFTGGLQLYTRPLDSEVVEACNVDFRADGGFCRRKPVNSFGAELPAKPCNIELFEDREGVGLPPNPRVFVSLDDGTVWQIIYEDNGTLTTSGPIPGIPTSDMCYRSTQINFRNYFYDGDDCTVCYDGQTATVLPWDTSPDYIEPDVANGVLGATPVTGFPKAEFVTVHGGFAWAANVLDPVTGEEHCNRLWRSWPLTDDPAGSEQAWGENDWVDIDPGLDGDCITGVVSCGEQLYVFKTHSVYRIDGYNEENITVTPLCQDVGAANCDAIACCDCRLWFFDARKGLHVLDDQGLRYAFQSVRPLIDDEMVNCAELPEKVRVGCCNGRVYVSMPSADSSENDVTYVFDPTISQNGTWTKYDLGFCIFDQVCPSEFKVKATCLAATNRCNHLVSLEGEGDVDDFGCSRCPIYTKVQTRWFDGGNPFTEKKWCNPEWIVESGGGSYRVTATVDYGAPCAREDLPLDVPEPLPTLCTELCVRETVKLTKDSEPMPGPCLEHGELTLVSKDADRKEKLCGPELGHTTGCVLSLCIEGPACDWCVCSFLLLYLEEPLRC